MIKTIQNNNKKYNIIQIQRYKKRTSTQQHQQKINSLICNIIFQIQRYQKELVQIIYTQIV